MKIFINKSSTDVTNRASEWLRKLYVPAEGAFRFSAQAPVCLLGSCCAALASEILGILSNWSADQLQAWADYIQSFQKEDGWFEDPYLKPPQGNVLDPAYLRGHATFLAVMALDALGQAPRQPLTFLETWRADSRLYDWIDQLDWTNPWRESNWVEWVGYWLLADAGLTAADVPLPKEKLPVGFNGLMRWLEDHQDPTTGYWGNPPYRGPKQTLHQMAAAYHHYVFYYATAKPLRFKDRIIDHTLSLQQPDGLFVPGRIGGGPCEDTDAIDILANMYRLVDYRRDEIEQALSLALIALLKNQRSDGAFVYACNNSSITSLPSLLATLFRPLHQPGLSFRIRLLRQYISGSSQHYAGCQSLPFRTNGGDMYSQWFRPLAIAIAASAIGKDRSAIWWNFGFPRQITQGWWPGSIKFVQNRKLNTEKTNEPNC